MKRDTLEERSCKDGTNLDFDIEKASNLGPSFFLAGLDEVGRGPLAGPVVAACAFWQGSLEELKVDLHYLESLGVTDSKLIKDKQREEIVAKLSFPLREDQILKSPDQNLCRFQLIISEIDNLKIDEINILQASLLAMGNCWDRFFSKDRGKILIDGNKFPHNLKNDPRAETVIKGDQKSKLIGLASIVAKVYRDKLMKNYAKTYPGYGLERHAGYPTKAHKEAIIKLGITPIHRKSFKGVKEHLSN